MKGKLNVSLHPYLFQRFSEVCAKREMSQTLENILIQYNKDHICNTQRYKKGKYITFTIFTIETIVLDEFFSSLGISEKKSIVIGLLIKQYLEGLNEL